MKTQFIEKRFRQDTLDVIAKANEILEEYDKQGLILTLRQLYYQFVARGILKNKQTEYSRLGSIISDARLAGHVDWAMMEDRTRQVETLPVWDKPSSIIEAVANQYQEDLWLHQKYRPEIWIEKEALVGVIERACRDLRVSYFACRGYVSQSAQYEASRRFKKIIKSGQKPIVLHFGDHDPSGIDMTRENRDKLALLSGANIEVRRLALNMEQVDQYNPPPNPAKETDSRHASYSLQYGDESWELDALEPSVIDALIRKEVSKLIDPKKWKAAEKREEFNRGLLQTISDRWDDVEGFVS